MITRTLYPYSLETTAGSPLSKKNAQKLGSDAFAEFYFNRPIIIDNIIFAVYNNNKLKW